MRRIFQALAMAEVALGWSSADFQSAVSQGFQPASVPNARERSSGTAPCRLEIGDTADWKSALLRRNLAPNNYPTSVGAFFSGWKLAPTDVGGYAWLVGDQAMASVRNL